MRGDDPHGPHDGTEPPPGTVEAQEAGDEPLPEPPPEPLSISQQLEIPANVPMHPLIDDEELGLFTPASLQRHQAQSGGGILLAPRDTGPAVFELQKELRALGLLEDEEDEPGVYGPDTEQAVCAFQEANGFVDTGKVDNRTRARLRQAFRDLDDD